MAAPDPDEACLANLACSLRRVILFAGPKKKLLFLSFSTQDS
jgi:hypothetical protein